VSQPNPYLHTHPITRTLQNSAGQNGGEANVISVNLHLAPAPLPENTCDFPQSSSRNSGAVNLNLLRQLPIQSFLIHHIYNDTTKSRARTANLIQVHKTM